MMKRTIILSLALLVGLAAWYAMIRLKPNHDLAAQIAVQSEPTSEVLVFARELDRGTYVTDDVIQWERRLDSTIPQMAVVRVLPNDPVPEDLNGTLVRRDVDKGEFVRRDALVEGSASFLALAVSPGMRAVAIKITPEKIAGGYILPDDHVDVIHTIVRDLNEDGVANGVSSVVLRNVRVLAIGDTPTRRNVHKTADEQDAAVNAQAKTSLTGETATLQVSEEQAMVLHSAGSTGSLSLALRPIEDQGHSEIGDVTTVSEQMPKTHTNAMTAVALAQPNAPGQTAQDREITIIVGGISTTASVPASQVTEVPEMTN